MKTNKTKPNTTNRISTANKIKPKQIKQTKQINKQTNQPQTEQIKHINKTNKQPNEKQINKQNE